MDKKIKLCPVKTYAPILKLNFHPKNPREIQKHKLEELKKSIVDNGFFEPILVWKKGGIVLAGNHRLKAVLELREEGYEFISPSGEKDVLPVVIEDVDKDTAESILFSTNNSYAHWVDEKLRLAVSDASKSKLMTMGFDEVYIDTMLKNAVEDVESATAEIDGDIDEDGPEGDDSDDALTKKMALRLDEVAYDALVEVLGEVSQAINPDWMQGMGFDEAVLTLVGAIKESGIIEELKSEKAEKKKKKKSKG